MRYGHRCAPAAKRNPAGIHGRDVTFQLAEVAVLPQGVRGNPDAHCLDGGTAGTGMKSPWGRKGADVRWERCASAKAKRSAPALRAGRPMIWLQAQGGCDRISLPGRFGERRNQARRIGKSGECRMKIRTQVIQFSSAGSLNTILHFATISLLIGSFALRQSISNAVTYLIASSFSFLINSVWSFEVKPHVPRYSRFQVIALLGLAVSTILGHVSDILGWYYAITFFLTALIVPFISFLIRRRHTFSSNFAP